MADSDGPPALGRSSAAEDVGPGPAPDSVNTLDPAPSLESEPPTAGEGCSRMHLTLHHLTLLSPLQVLHDWHSLLRLTARRPWTLHLLFRASLPLQVSGLLLTVLLVQCLRGAV